jgi:hypothetical protein
MEGREYWDDGKGREQKDRNSGKMDRKMEGENRSVFLFSPMLHYFNPPLFRQEIAVLSGFAVKTLLEVPKNDYKISSGL